MLRKKLGRASEERQRLHYRFLAFMTAIIVIFLQIASLIGDN